MSALTIHKPILVTNLGDMFSFMPCSRKEPAELKNIKRHLSQFYQIEVEMEGGFDRAVDELEKMTKYIIDNVIDRCADELDILDRDLSSPSIPFKRISYQEAVKMAKDIGMDITEDNPIDWDVEKRLSEHIGEPFFLTRFPSRLISDRGFLYKVDGKELLDFDLILPEGHGEVSSGSEREFEYDKIVEKIGRDQIKSFKSYLDIIKSGLKPTSGFGVGVERLTKFICGLDDISEASPFPKVPGVS